MTEVSEKETERDKKYQRNVKLVNFYQIKILRYAKFRCFHQNVNYNHNNNNNDADDDNENNNNNSENNNNSNTHIRIRNDKGATIRTTLIRQLKSTSFYID